jgi:hypothetical protein
MLSGLGSAGFLKNNKNGKGKMEDKILIWKAKSH